MAFVFPWKHDWGLTLCFFGENINALLFLVKILTLCSFCENMKFEKPRRRSGGRKDAPCSGDQSNGALKEENILKSDEEY